MIARVIVVDPKPTGVDDLLVYQIAGKRHLELFLELCERAGLEAVTVSAAPRQRGNKEAT